MYKLNNLNTNIYKTSFGRNKNHITQGFELILFPQTAIPSGNKGKNVFYYMLNDTTT